jgi:hypothetical protein
MHIIYFDHIHPLLLPLILPAVLFLLGQRGKRRTKEHGTPPLPVKKREELPRGI